MEIYLKVFYSYLSFIDTFILAKQLLRDYGLFDGEFSGLLWDTVQDMAALGVKLGDPQEQEKEEEEGGALENFEVT